MQHPGNNSKTLQTLTSHWPDGGEALPRGSVGALLELLLAHRAEGEGYVETGRIVTVMEEVFDNREDVIRIR